MIRNPIAGALLLAALVLGGCRGTETEAPSLPFYRTADLTPEWLAESDPSDVSMHRISPFRFVNQEGGTVASEDFDGKIYVANFFFVHCTGICPTMRTNLAKVQQVYADDDEVLLLSHTVNPEVDTVQALQNYAKVNGVLGGKWHLVTGAKDEVYTLARDSYFADLEEAVENDFLHTETFVLVDQNRHIRGVYNGTLPFDVQRLIEDIAMLKQEEAG